MDEINAENIIQLFKEQENRLSNIVSNIPFNDSNKGIVLPILSSIIVECCSLIDTILREEFDETIKAKKECTIVDYAIYYEQKYGFSKTKNLLFIFPPSYIMPFFEWKDTSGNFKPLFWWQNYNQLKHSRIGNINLSTLETAINSLCALHQAIAQIHAFVYPLIRNNMISYGDLDLNYVVSQLNDVPNKITVLVESQFFATPIGQFPFPDDIKAIRPFIYGNSKKLSHFIGKN